MKLSFGCTDWRCSGRARLTESLTAGSFQPRIMAAVFLFRRRKLLTTSILILITLPRTADLASLYHLDKLSTHVLYFLKHFIHLTLWSLKTFSPIPNSTTCCSWEVEVSLHGKANESCLDGSSRWTVKSSFIWNFGLGDFLLCDQVAHFQVTFSQRRSQSAATRQSFSLMNMLTRVGTATGWNVALSYSHYSSPRAKTVYIIVYSVCSLCRCFLGWSGLLTSRPKTILTSIFKMYDPPEMEDPRCASVFHLNL